MERTLVYLRVPASAAPDVAQDATIETWNAARHGRVVWHRPTALRAYLRVVVLHLALAWFRENPRHGELHEADALVPSPEALFIAREQLRFMRKATTRERWRALRAQALGVPVHAIAAREHVPTATVYDRIRRARKDIAAALARDDAAIYVRRRR